jgi:hypothetical protein
VVVVSGWRILNHTLAALTMTKMKNFSMKNEKNAMLFGKYIMHDIYNTTIEEMHATI